ncbi:MAG: multidrug transporter [Monoglobaceae bacterium]
MEVSKQDWKLFREKIGDWQESYMEKLNNEYIEILKGNGAPSEKFWKLEKRIRNDKRHKGVLISMSKQDMPFDLVSLIIDGVIDLNDIEDFSDDLKDTIRFLVER